MNKFIYFDVGGVVIQDFSGTNKWEELRRNIGIRPEQDEEFNTFFDKYETEVCLGRNIETLLPMLRNNFGVSFPKGYSLLQDFVDRFEKNKSIWPVIEYAKNNYKIGLLTNMYTGMLDKIYEKGLMPKIEWDAVIDSSIENVVKPQREIFELAQKRAGVNADEILFVENSKKHVEAAKSMNWYTFLYNSSNVVKASKDLLEQLTT